MQGEPLRCPAHVAAVARPRPPLVQPGVTPESPQAVVNQWKKIKFYLSKVSVSIKKNIYINIEDLGDFFESDS